MRVLAVETSDSLGSIAFLRTTPDGEQLTAERVLDEPMRHGRDLTRKIRNMLLDLSLRLSDLDFLAVSVGPGSYTGTRVGIAAAKALHMALGIPVVSVTSLEALARAAPPSCTSTHPHIIPVIDARRGAVYWGHFLRTAAAITPLTSVRIGPLEHLLATIETPALFLGDGCLRHPELLRETGVMLAPRSFWMPRASWIARIATEKAARGVRQDPRQIQPLYLRLPAARERLAKSPSARIDPNPK